MNAERRRRPVSMSQHASQNLAFPNDSLPVPVRAFSKADRLTSVSVFGTGVAHRGVALDPEFPQEASRHPGH